MPQVTYVFAKRTQWRDFAWQPGDKLVRSELPEELVNTLIEEGNVVLKEAFEPVRVEAPPVEVDAPKRKAKE